MPQFDISRFSNTSFKSARYERQLSRLRDEGLYTDSIEQAVDGAIANINLDQSRSFVIYGEPQSGKTEMMISLTAKLLDEGHKIIVILLNDNVQLLSQNLDRFRRSSIDPSPRNFSEILDPCVTIGDGEWIIFAKKNSKDLQKLINKVGGKSAKVVIDDEADYATPNAKINTGEQTKINELVEVLLGSDGIYIGVTATPARLDLNNTFNNQNEKWIDFPTHPEYTGHDVFFPVTLEKQQNLKFQLTLLPDEGDDPKHLRNALFSFLINVAYLNLFQNTSEKNYCMLVHTSGKKADHSEDYKQVNKIMNSLKEKEDKSYEGYVKGLWESASQRFPNQEDDLVDYILSNISRTDVVVLNSDRIIEDTKRATFPSSPFTITIGGNIVSRGVTFENLLSMFFTRDVKHKIQQDTYIQRARMFGARNPYLERFELTIPESLYLDWQKCFVFHQLALSAIKAGKGTPVWLEDSRVVSTAGSSVNKANVDVTSGEMSFEMFDFNRDVEDIIGNGNVAPLERLINLSGRIGDEWMSHQLVQYISLLNPNGINSVAIHPTRLVSKESSYHDTLLRPKRIFGGEDIKKFPSAIHHIILIRNNNDKARVVYKYVGNIKTLKRRN